MDGLIQQALGNIQKTASSLFGSATQAVQQGMQRGFQNPSSVPDNPITQFGRNTLLPIISNQPLLNNPTPIKSPISPTIGQYTQGNILHPLEQGVKSLINPQSNILQRATGAAQAMGGAFGATPIGLASNVIQGGIAGALRSVRTGQNFGQSVQQGMSQPTGVGSQGLGLKGIPGMAVDLGSGLISPGNIGKVADTATAVNAARMLKGVSPNVFSMHPEDEKLALSLADTILNTKDKLTSIDNTNLQNLAEHYLGGKYTTGTNKQIAQAFQYALASKYNGIPGKLPNMGLVNTEAPTVLPQAAIKLKVKGQLTADQQFDQMKAESSYPNISIPIKKGTVIGANGEPLARLSNKELPGVSTPGAIPLRQAAHNALTEYTGFRQNIREQGNVAAQTVKNAITPEDTPLFRNAVEHPENAGPNSLHASNPTAFTNAVQTFRNFTDKVHQDYSRSGNKLGYLQNFYSHILDLSDPETKARYDSFVASKFQNSKGYFSKERVFKNIDELEAAGFKLKNKTVPEDILTYSGAVGKSGSAQSFISEIQKTHPDQIATNVSYIPRDIQGRPFRQLSAPGLEGAFVSPELYQHVKNLGHNDFLDSKLIKGADAINRGLKSVQLGLGGFHALKTTIRQVVNNPLIIPRAMVNSVSPSARLAFREAAINDGTIAGGSRLGITYGTSGDVLREDTSVMDKIQSRNPIETFNRGLFGGLIDTYKIDATRHILSKYDINDPKQLEVARSIGQQVNNVFGGINYEAMNRNKVFQQILRSITLAPDFNEGKIRSTAKALNVTDWSPAALYARKNVLGEAIVVGTLAELGRRLTTGKFDTNVKDLLSNTLLDPNIPLPAQFNNPKNNKQQTAGLPGSNLADLARGVKDPTSFALARGSAGLSMGTKLLTGKDYYGNPLVNPYTTADTPLNRVVALGQSELPIPAVQAIKTLQGRQTLPTAIANTLGARVHTDQSAPAAQATTAYFNNLNKTAATLNPNDKNIFLGVIHPTTKDPEGNPVADKNSAVGPDKYMTLLAHPAVLAAEAAFQKSQPNHDPLWDLPAGQRNVVMAAATKLPNQVSTYSKYLQAQAWYQPFLNARNTYYSSLPAQPATSTQLQGSLPRPTPTTYVQAQLNAKNWSDPQVQGYLNANTAYNNNQLAAMGLPAVMGSGGYASSAPFGSAKYFQNRIKSQIRSSITRTHKYKVGKAKAPKRLKVKMSGTKLASIHLGKFKVKSKIKKLT